MKKLSRVSIIMLIMMLFSTLYVFAADEEVDNERIISLSFPDYANGIVNGVNSATLRKTTFDGRRVVEITPNPSETGAKYISVDGFSYSSAGIDLRKYHYVAYEYYYKSKNPMKVHMEADILTNGNVVTKRIYGTAPRILKANQWDIMLFDFTEVEKYLNPEATNYNLKQMHFRPFGSTSRLSVLSADERFYVSKIIFFAEKPTLNYRNAFLDGYEDGTFKPGLPVTRAEICKMVASCMAGEDSISGTPDFDDVDGDEWFAKYVGFLQERGYLDFFGDKLYPDKTVNRSEFAKLVINAGIVTDLNGAFNPENGTVFPAKDTDELTRIDAAMILNQLRGAIVDKDDIPNDIFILYLDVEKTNPYFAEIAEASFDHASDDSGKWEIAFQNPVDMLIEKLGEGFLYDTVAGDAKVQELDMLEEQRKNEIRLTPNMDVSKIKGKKVYVSERGDDSNDGSEDYPVRTIAKGNSMVKSGDVLLLERGGLWRERFITVSGVTYTAYGYGDKPKIYGSPENAADQNKWVLVYENKETGALIWKFYREDLLDVGTLVFNDGEGYAMKEVPSCVGADYYVRGQENLPADQRTPYDYRVQLDKDLEFFHAANSVVTKNSNIGDYIDISKSVGPLYLRCDNGNPGKVFSSIELNTRGSNIAARDNVTIDNLCVMYTGVHGISSGTVKNLVVTNCEFGWIGGSIQGYTANGNTRRTATRLGNGVEVYGGCEGYTIDNCYVYQCYDAGVTHQYSNLSAGNCIMNDVTYSNNLITECVYSIEYFLGTYEGGGEYIREGNNILFDSNLMRRAGYGFGSFRPDGYNQRHIRSSDRNNPFNNYRIVNNIFDRSVYQLLATITDREQWTPELSGNTFIQGVGNGFYSFAYFGSANMKLDAAEHARNILKDKTAQIYFVDYIPYYQYTYPVMKKYPVTDSDRK